MLKTELMDYLKETTIDFTFVAIIMAIVIIINVIVAFGMYYIFDRIAKSKEHPDDKVGNKVVSDVLIPSNNHSLEYLNEEIDRFLKERKDTNQRLKLIRLTDVSLEILDIITQLTSVVDRDLERSIIFYANTFKYKKSIDTLLELKLIKLKNKGPHTVYIRNYKDEDYNS